ncbi:hypothetical protein SAY86_001980 [Trapa natans]|uniref:Homeobox-leucine zipper protein n=1 Tax=Trapa natans TaxID=22666 RepID=A0AAN7LF86_TRANT|nr:hypothetical protein SAY86_001980 [Trapa natans]
MAQWRAGTNASSARKMAALGGTGSLLDSHWVHASSTVLYSSNSRIHVQGQLGDTKTRSPALFQAGEMGAAANGEEGNELQGHPRMLSGKRRRLAAHQVQSLERSFEVDNRLEPKRKAKLAKELGLEPRQVAIWFQNRRARYRSKQIEKDYDSLKASYDALKSNRDSILEEKDKLKHEMLGDGCTEEMKKAGGGEPSELACPLKLACPSADPGNSSHGLDRGSSEMEDGSSRLVVGRDSLLMAPFVGLPKIEDEDHPFWKWTYN